MENMKDFLLDNFKAKTAEENLEQMSKLKQYVESVLLTSSAQTQEEALKTMFTGLSTVRDFFIGELNSTYFAGALRTKISEHESQEAAAEQAKEVHEQDVEALKAQGQKKTS